MCCMGFLPLSLQALTLPLSKSSDVVGRLQVVQAHMGETLTDVGRRYDVGSLQIKEANPNIKVKQVLHAGALVIIPNQFILPNVERQGVVINLAEQRLYYYPDDKTTVITEPVGIGRKGQWQTPLGLTKITKKVLDPLWHPTANVRTEAASHGTPIPWQFPPGPNNPLGRHILRLGWATYLIHSTNQPDSVGGRVSAGCIRMLPKGIERLYDLISVGTTVLVINEPYKMGWKNNKLYFESHTPLIINKITHRESMRKLIWAMREFLNASNAWVSWDKVKNHALLHQGIPQIVGSIKM